MIYRGRAPLIERLPVLIGVRIGSRSRCYSRNQSAFANEFTSWLGTRRQALAHPPGRVPARW